MLHQRPRPDDLDLELRLLLAGRFARPEEDGDEEPPMTTERPHRLVLMRTVTVAATAAWLALRLVVDGGILLTLAWIVATPFVVAAVVFGLDLVLSPVDRARLRRQVDPAGGGEELSPEPG